MRSNCGAGEDSWESLGLQGDQEVNSEYSLEELMLKLQYFDHVTQETDSLEKTRMLEKIEGRRRRGRQRMKWLEEDDRGWNGWMASLIQWTWVWVNSRSWWWTGRPGVLQAMGSQRVRHNWATELNWTEYDFNVLFVFVLLCFFFFLQCNFSILCPYFHVLNVSNPVVWVNLKTFNFVFLS